MDPVNRDDARLAGMTDMVRRAGEVIARYWPLRTFVCRNPLHGLESHHFDEAVKVGQRFVGGTGYLSNAQYQGLVRDGRIHPTHLDAALRPLCGDQDLMLGTRTLSQGEVLRAHLVTTAAAPVPANLVSLVRTSPHRQAIEALAERLPPTVGDLDGQDGQETLAMRCDRLWRTGLKAMIDHEVIKWCEAFLDEGYAAWSMPGRDLGFYGAWKALACRELSPCGIVGSRAMVAALPDTPEAALLEHLDALGIPEAQRQTYLTQHLAALYGWSGFITWRADQAAYDWQQAYPISLVAYLAVRLWYERALVRQTCRDRLGQDGTLAVLQAYDATRTAPADAARQQTEARLAAAWRLATLAPGLDLTPADWLEASEATLHQVLDWLAALPPSAHGPVWLKAFEAGFQDDLLRKVRTSLAHSATTQSEARPLAQLVFCIDVRSEPFRRHLEAVNHYETLGFAGFFGVPIAHRDLDAYHGTAQVPAIAQPQYDLHEVARPTAADRMAQHRRGVTFLKAIKTVVHDLKVHVLTPYVAVETIGWLYGIPMVGRTLFPSLYRRLGERLSRWLAPPVATTLTIDRTSEGLGLTVDEQAHVVATALRTMGLTANFGRLLVVCGHKNTAANNPFESALDCGACGGNPGKANARAFALMANKPEVRERLAADGIRLPGDTYVLAAQHNTTTDAIEVFDPEDVPESHAADLTRLMEDLRLASVRTNRERYHRLLRRTGKATPSAVARHLRRRGDDWSQVQPEWGLSGNGAFVVGRRDLTRWVDLGGRAFLHSYDSRTDATGDLLEAVMTGPQVVGQWINSEYYFAATDPGVYGAGSKVYHNVVGKFGVMAGPQGDLRTGLSWQSVMAGQTPYHEPLRLLAIIEAPRERIMAIMQRHRHIQQLYDNQWVHLVAVDPDDHAFYRYDPHQGWVALADAASATRQHTGNGGPRR